MGYFAICHLSVVPIRSESSDASEIVSQLLFGELVEVLKVEKKLWAKVRCQADGYEGWMDVRQIFKITAEEAMNYKSKFSTAYEFVHEVVNGNHFIPITMGASLPFFDGINLRIADKHYTYSGKAIGFGAIEPTADWIMKVAKKYLYAPYLWGGRTPFGIDCSGFTQVVYKIVGIQLLRDASQQATQGREIGFVEEAQSGDLAFFENDKNKITHVGIVLPENKIIHASGQVRIDNLDHQGIFNQERNIYTHKLRIIKRFITDLPVEAAKPLAQNQEVENQNQINLF
jgi:gamma-D-glutamyl-L-lysine dipeptidyl-peptidase